MVPEESRHTFLKIPFLFLRDFSSFSVGLLGMSLDAPFCSCFISSCYSVAAFVFFLLRFISRSFSSPLPSKLHLLMSAVSSLISEGINYSFV